MTTFRKFFLYSPDLFLKNGTDKLRQSLGGGLTEELDPSTGFVFESQNLNNIKIYRTAVKERAKQTFINDDLIFPSFKAPVLFIGHEDIADDLEWSKIIVGGNYSQFEYPGIYTNQVLEATSFVMPHPYEKMEAKNLAADQFATLNPTVEFECKYQTFVDSFENKDATIYEMPNPYLFDVYNDTQENSYTDFFGTANDNMKEYVSLDNKYDISLLTQIPNEETFSWPNPELSEQSNFSNLSSTQYLDSKYNIKEYCKTWSETDYSEQTKNFLNQRMKNVYLSNDVDYNVEETYPYYTSIKMDLSEFASANRDGGYFKFSLGEEGFEFLFLDSIKKLFVDSEQVKANTMNVAKITDSPIESTLEKLTMDVNYADIQDIVFDNLNKEVMGDDFVLISDNPLYNRMMFDESGQYRYVRNSATSQFVKNLTYATWAKIGEENYPFRKPGVSRQFALDNIVDITNPDQELDIDVLDFEEEWDLLDFLNLPETSEILDPLVALRIEKKGVSDEEVGATERKTLQNFYLVNRKNSLDFKDSQVKYGETYTYDVYGYKAVLSYKYKLSNPKISRLATTTEEGEYCLKFYNPSTEQLVDLEWLEEGEPFYSYFRQVDTSGGDRSNVISEFRFISEMNLEVETQIRIYEFPMYSKEITILDNPPRQVDVSSFQRKDNSQVIGFYSRKDPFVEKTYPPLLNSQEDDLRTKYFESKNLLSTDTLTEQSVTSERYLQIFRTNSRPTSMKNFDGKLIAEKDLRLKRRIFENLEDQEFQPTTQVASTCFYEEKIQTNQTYYYALRFLNEHRIPGEFSPVIALNLVDDGGYKYLKADSFTPEELKVGSKYENPSIFCKKILQVLPNINQINFDTSEMDFTKPAYTQMSKLKIGNVEEQDMLWDKKFKIRLSSKKTSEKIDLNLTFTLRDLVEFEVLEEQTEEQIEEESTLPERIYGPVGTPEQEEDREEPSPIRDPFREL